MPPPKDARAFLDLVRKSGLIPEPVLALLAPTLPATPAAVAEALVRAGHLATFQTRLLLEGRHKGFVLGQYRVLRPLGKGGMGLVYLAEHVTLSRRVTVKVLRADRMPTSGVKERFAREGRATAALEQPNIVRLYDVGQDGGTHFLIMEYVEGTSLDAILQHRGRLPVAEAVGYAIQAARGLQHAHERGIVHRDIKPANLLIDRSGTLKILDMGLARFYDDRTDNLTERVGGILGSPDYIAPEQVSNQLDPRTDIYSLGATLYAMLLGEPPFPGGSIPAKLAAHRDQAVVPPEMRDPKIPPGLSRVILRMLAKAPAERHPTPAAVAEALAPFVRPPLQSAPATPQRLWPLAAAVLLACLAAAAWVLFRLARGDAP